MRDQHSIRALTTVLRGSAVPYGYTLTVLATHAVLTNEHGNPDVLEVLLFVTGAVVAFSLLGIVAERLAPEPLQAGSRDMIRSGAIHALAIGCAFGAAVLIALIQAISPGASAHSPRPASTSRSPAPRSSSLAASTRITGLAEGYGPGVRSTAASAVAASASRIAAPSRALDSART